MPQSFISELSETSLHILNSTLNGNLPASLSVSDGTALAQRTFVFLLSTLWAYFLSFLRSASNVAGQMIREIISQMIGTSLMGIIVYRYREELKDVIAAVVNTAGAAVPEDWLDEEALVDLIEDAAGIDTPSESEEDVEKTPLLHKESSMKLDTGKTAWQRRKKCPTSAGNGST